jgi:hypothetical protein
MLLLAEGIPKIPDLTHAEELLQFGQEFLKFGQWVLLLIVGLGLVLGLINFSYYKSPNPIDRTWLDLQLANYGTIWRSVFHVLAIATILVSSFFLCSTLANRYHHWEQDKIAQTATTVAGERVEQPAPQVSYKEEQLYRETVVINRRASQITKTRQIDRSLPPSTSQVEVKLTQLADPASLKLVYLSDFAGNYQVTNTLNGTKEFVFQVPPPTGYTLLQDYRVERNGRQLEPKNQGEYNFPLTLAPGESSKFRVTYKAQGSPRWVYNANGRSLPKFNLSVLADFPDADFASGIVPTQVKAEGRGTRFSWTFADNVSVQNPFGVFSATQRFRNTGILPRLLLMAPGILLWWLLLLYLSVPLRWQDTIVASGVFFACILTLTYTSRLFDPKLAWGLLLPILLWFGWILGQRTRRRWQVVGVTFSGAVLPVLGFLVPYTGLTLGIAGLSSVAWLMKLERKDRSD